MKKEKMAWAVSLMLIALLAMQLPGSIPARDEDYAFVRTLVDIHRKVAARYVEEVDADDLRQGAIDGMLNKLDPYTDYVAPKNQKAFDEMLEGQFQGVGIQLRQKESGEIEVVTPIDDSPAFRAGITAGDVILKVNGESIADKRLPDITKMIQGQAGSAVTLRIRRQKDQELDIAMERQQIMMPTVKGFNRNGNNSWNYYVDEQEKIAYLRVTQFTGDTYDKMRPVIETLLADGMRGLILDLRFNPGGRLDSATDIVDMFISQGVIVSTRGRGRPEEAVFATAKGTLPTFPLVVLINGSSASAAEVVAGSLKDNRRALVVGSRSFGKGSVQELIPLEQESGELKLTVAYYYLPSGRLVHRKKDATDWGVIPTIKVEVDPAVDHSIMLERFATELFHKPGTAPTTHPATMPYGSDVQLQRGVDSMLAIIALQGNMPTTAPAAAEAPEVKAVEAPFGEEEIDPQPIVPED